MGPAGSGKSTLAKSLEKLRPDLVARVPVDFFFAPRECSQSVSDYLARPFAYDWDAVDRAIAADGPQRSTPDCDFTEFRWRSPYGGLPIADATTLALDGMRPHPRCDLLILLDLDTTTQRERLIARDRRWNTSVAARTEHLTATFAAGIAELPRDPDLVLLATDPIDRNVDAIVRLLEFHRVGVR